MKIFLVTCVLVIICNLAAVAQTNNNDTHKGTIKVQKKGHLIKAMFDNVNYRLVGMDQYGNIIDSAVVEFEMSVTIRGLFHSEKTSGCFLSKTMQQELERCDNTSKIFFDNIKAKEKDGSIVTLPKFQFRFAAQYDKEY